MWVFRTPISKRSCLGRNYCLGKFTWFFSQQSNGNRVESLCADVHSVCMCLTFTDIKFCGTGAYKKGWERGKGKGWGGGGEGKK